MNVGEPSCRRTVFKIGWDMEFNASKCQVVHVTGSRKTVKTDYVLHGQVLESVPCARYLGVDISCGLTWNSHIDCVTANANRTLGFIRRNIKTKMPKVREAAYNSLVRPQLEYASAVWDLHTKVRISRPFIAQDKLFHRQNAVRNFLIPSTWPAYPIHMTCLSHPRDFKL